jgi:hypothetical protein
MFQRICQYPLINAGGRSYSPRAYSDPQPDGTWAGWLVFPLGGGAAIASDRETTQVTFDELLMWASSLSSVYVEGALARALQLAEQPPEIDHLARAEYEALEDADRLEVDAQTERIAAETDAMAAAQARADADQLRRERRAAEQAWAATEETVANLHPAELEDAAKNARAVAADARGRRRKPITEARRSTGAKRRK